MNKMVLCVSLVLALSAGTRHLEAEKRADLVIGLMPACNSIPFVVAAASGEFRRNGLDVTLVPFNGQLERETALQTGAIDGTVSDLINTIQSWAHGFGARVASVTEGNFSLLASPHSRLRSLADWPAGGAPRVRTGLLENSIVYYLTESMLRAGGADLSRLELVPVVQLPARVEMLLADRVEAACLPEPLATLAVARGARVLADADGMGTTPGVLLFTRKSLAEKHAQVTALYKSYNAAVDEVNARPDAYLPAIVAGCGFPPAVSGLLTIPKFRHAFLPPRELVADVGRWMVEKGLTGAAPSYPDIVDTSFANAPAD